MIKSESVSLKLSRFMHITKLNKFLIAATLSYITIFSIISLNSLAFLNLGANLYGLATDLISLVVIMSIFFVVQCSLLARKAFVYVSIGLMLWIVGATADVLDEVVIQPLWVSMYIEDLCRSSGMVITAYGLFKTMTFMQKMHKRLAQEFIIDDLTKVYNRRCFYEYVDRSHDKQYTLIVIDIDHFKSINDEFGHDMGDRVLKVFAKKVNALFENENMFARIGGEEFAGYFPSSQFENVVDVSEQILEKVRTINVKDDRFLTVSIGIAKRLNKHEHFDTVMKRADQALYLAKDSGRNQLRLAP
ncbi:hypothetical protein PESP_a3144 [Pseudoalteromonas espejiana DSM 9414]|uniref:diguanylate cyclase n=2 Tax=Pseudoalteromonas espejiana TaxID=28107 RepID=A0A510XU80_9GAMM|nr:hypothetical protein PESP_a3144 [Pseudoalteromonas espejiana DSM 9414]GEK54137.1 hypothetical protein PES01_09820 [Pseudoalteromonas espejiana]